MLSIAATALILLASATILAAVCQLIGFGLVVLFEPLTVWAERRTMRR